MVVHTNLKIFKQGFCPCDRCESESISFDAILCFHAHTFRLAQLLCSRCNWKIPIILREHNLEYGLVASYRRSLPLPLQPLAMLFERLTYREELRSWKNADAVAFITHTDLEEAKCAGTGGHLTLVPEGTPLPRLDESPTVLPRVILLLNARATQSLSNARKFLRDCWIPSAASDDLAGISLAITGVNSLQLEEFFDITIEEQIKTRIGALGFVKELGPTLRSALAMVSPTYVGGGIRKKILEGMAHEVPVLATRIDVRSCNYFLQITTSSNLTAQKPFA